ncbi:MAG: NUDIX domain-containing protein [Patescibacteria group bacterium]|nr:NUDIX domain-containing protein [Patescibacteria group bacterium]
MKNRITSAVAVYLILERADGDILIMRRCNTGYQDGMYQVCAGHLEPCELPTEAMIREAKEELGIIIERDALVLTHVSARPKHDETGNRIDFFYSVRRWQGEPQIMEPQKCDDIRWSSPGCLPSNFTPHVKSGLQLSKQGLFASEFDLDWIKSHSVYGIK